MTGRTRRAVVAAVLDTIAVLVFVAIGRRSHDEGSALEQIVETAAPFAVGVAVGWLIARAWRAPTALLTGLLIWPVTIVIGMLGRRFVFERGTAVSFVIVASVFLGTCLVGWRALARFVERRQNSTATAGTS